MHIHVYSLPDRLSVDFCCCRIEWMHQASAELRWMGERVSFDSSIKETALRETAALFKLQTR